MPLIAFARSKFICSSGGSLSRPPSKTTITRAGESSTWESVLSALGLSAGTFHFQVSQGYSRGSARVSKCTPEAEASAVACRATVPSRETSRYSVGFLKRATRYGFHPCGRPSSDAAVEKGVGSGDLAASDETPATGGGAVAQPPATRAVRRSACAGRITLSVILAAKAAATV